MLQAACRILGESVARKFPTRARQAIGSFIILRLLSPSIVAPEGANLSLSGLNGGGRRALVDVSKLITNLASDVVVATGSTKEGFTTDYAQFRSPENVARMAGFLDALMVPSPEGVLTRARSIPTATSTSASLDDAFDELYLSLICQTNLTAVKSALQFHPKKDAIWKSLLGWTDRSGLTPSRLVTKEPFALDQRRARYDAFMRRKEAVNLPPFDSIFREVSVIPVCSFAQRLALFFTRC